jgi:opacity protein-like surface antigen
MNLKNLCVAAVLAALCAMPAISADPGPDVTVTVDTRPTVSCQTGGSSYTVASQVTVSEDDCVFVIDYDGNNFVAICHPQSTPPGLEPRVEVDWDCHIYAYA